MNHYKIAIVGSGPAALMAADVVARSGHQVTIFEKRPGAARKLLIAGSSGLNITNSASASDFHKFYEGGVNWQQALKKFSPADWLKFIETVLKQPTFLGTSGRYFVKMMHAKGLLKAWRERLKAFGVQWKFKHCCDDFTKNKNGSLTLHFTNQPDFNCDAVCFCLGGGSYEPEETPVLWPKMFTTKSVKFSPFEAANVGYKVDWPAALLKEVEGKPLKNIILTTAKGKKRGDLIITAYGLEGTPIYTFGKKGKATIDLKADMTANKIKTQCERSKEKLSPLRLLKKKIGLSDTAQALLFHMLPTEIRSDLDELIANLKAFPVQILGPQPLEEAISSSGGIAQAALNQDLMFKNIPGAFAAGEMLDWHAPTGGFLIQGAVTQGFLAGEGMGTYLSQKGRSSY